MNLLAVWFVVCYKLERIFHGNWLLQISCRINLLKSSVCIDTTYLLMKMHEMDRRCLMGKINMCVLLSKSRPECPHMLVLCLHRPSKIHIMICTVNSDNQTAAILYVPVRKIERYTVCELLRFVLLSETWYISLCLFLAKNGWFAIL